MKKAFVEVRRGIVNVSAVVEAHWEGETLYVHFLGGAFERYTGTDGKLIYLAISEQSVNLLDAPKPEEKA